MSTLRNIEQREDVLGDSSAHQTPDRSRAAKRVLLVDDHDLFRQVLAVVLNRHAGFEEDLHAGSPAEARRVLVGPGRKPDIALIDIDLPNGGAVKLIGELRAAQVPVLALTGDSSMESRVRALRAGADEVLATSASGEEVVRAVRRLAYA